MENNEELENENKVVTETETVKEESKSTTNATTTEDSKDKKAMTGFILGLCSIIAWFIPIIGYPVTIAGIACSAAGLKSSNRGKAIAGLILSIIFLLVTIGYSVFSAILGAILALSY